MASNSTVEVIKADFEQKDNLEIKNVIADCTIPSSVEFDQPLSDFRVRFDHFVDTISTEINVIVSITRKIQQGEFDAVAELSCSNPHYTAEDQKSSVSGSCILKVCLDYCNFRIQGTKVYSASVHVKITSTKTSRNTVSDHADYSTTREVYIRQKNFSNDLYNNRESTGDVTIETASGTKHKAHKLILGTRSPFFKTMFEVDLKERKESKVKIDKFEEDLVVGLIEFMYFGWTESVETNPQGLLEIAHMYQVADLVKACWDSLMKTLTVKNAVELLRWSGKLDDDGAYKKEIGRFLFRNIGAIRKSEEFAALVKKDADLFLEICGLDF